MSKIIECQVNDEYVIGSGVVIGAAGSYGDVILRLKFNEMWNGLAILATFKDALCEHSAVISLLSSMQDPTVDGLAYLVEIPAVAKRLPGKVRLTLSGYVNAVMRTDDAGKVEYTVEEAGLTNTATTYFRVSESDSAVGEDTSVTPALAAQVVAELNLMAGFVAAAETELAGIKERETAENKRATAEEDRATAEEDRATAEEDRATAEEDRATAEEDRATAENKRVAAETQRAAAEEERRTTYGVLEDAVNAALDTQASLMTGNMKSALERIILLQESLIGGADV